MPRRLALIFAGGCLGTLLRWGVGYLNGSFPLGTLLVNLLGAFLLGLLLGRLSKSENPRVQEIRLFAGTGLLGSFTTYSAFALDSVKLLQSTMWLGFVYVLVTIVGGIMAAWAGEKVAR